MDIKTVLEYSPYDNKRRSPFIVEGGTASHEALFNKHFLVDYPEEINILNDKLKKVIDSESYNTILFYGASGSGKTTFLNHFMSQESVHYDFHYINLIEEPAAIDHEECIRKILMTKICGILDKEDNLAAIELYKYVVVQEAIRFFEKKDDNDVVMNYLGANRVEKEDADVYLDYIGHSRDGILVKGGNTNQGLLVMYVILELIQAKMAGDTTRKQVFIFDNLDEIPTQYIYSHSYKMIMSAFSEVQDFCNKTFDYDFLGNCNFIISYRSNNAQIIDRCQLEDRLILSTANVEFRNEYQVSYTSILSRRIQYYCEITKADTLQSNEWRVRELLNSEKDFCKKVIRPLFNYDYRMLSRFFVIHLMGKDLSKVDDALIKAPEPNQSKKTFYQTGARGLLLFNVLDSMLRDPSLRLHTYVDHEFESDAHCNIFRMAFTLLSNLGGWSLQDDDLVNAIKEENSFNDETPRISFFEFSKRVEKWYDKEMFISVIEGLIGAVAFNFEYPITLVGGLIDDYFKDEKTTHTTNALAQYIINVYSENPSLLANVYVKINPLCVIYCWRVFIHFEYFNLISSRSPSTWTRDFRYTPIPLYEINNENMLSWCLSSVFDTVKTILNRADEHFCEYCIKFHYAKCKIEKNDRRRRDKTQEDVGSSFETCKEVYQRFVDDGFCINNTMYAVRVITSHLNYLDQYKSYLWHKISDPEVSFRVQTLILNHMRKYLDLWRKRRVAEGKNLLEKYQENFDMAWTQIGHNKCVSIKVEEDFPE